MFLERADLSAYGAALDSLPPSMKNDPVLAFESVYRAIYARDFAAAEEMLNKIPNEALVFTQRPRGIWMLWFELLRGNHPSIEQFGAAREQLYRKVEADPTNPSLMAELATADVALGRKEEAVQEARRAMEMRPISEDALDGPDIATSFALVCAWANQSDLAFEQLNIVIRVPSGLVLTYGALKTDPGWDPLRKDPRFDKLLAKLAPRD